MMQQPISRLALALGLLAYATTFAQAGAVDSDSRATQRECDFAVERAFQGKMDDAEALFTGMLSRDNACGWAGLGNLHAMRGDFATALRLYERAIAADSADAGLVLNQALVLELSNEPDSAAAFAERGILLAGGPASARALLALPPESGAKAIAISKLFEIPLPGRKPVRVGTRDVRALIARASGRRPAIPDTLGIKSSRAETNTAFLFYWKH